MPTHTLYATEDRKRFFYVPDDASLPSGDFVVRSLTGKKLTVDPVALDVFEVPEAEAMKLAQDVLLGFADKVRTAAMGVAKALTQPPKLHPEAVKAREERVAANLKLGREQLRDDPAALGAALKATFTGILQAAQETVHEPEVAKERMKDVAEALRQEGLIPEGTDGVEGLPERLRELLASEDTVAKLDEISQDLRKASAELRASREEKVAGKKAGDETVN
ncbi:MAG: hypothetical protein Q8P18_18520 [Pseudomonadota bacterium]|nr:hypothetical protein [Pseudomonadota bacterium]